MDLGPFHKTETVDESNCALVIITVGHSLSAWGAVGDGKGGHLLHCLLAQPLAILNLLKYFHLIMLVLA